MEKNIFSLETPLDSCRPGSVNPLIADLERRINNQDAEHLSLCPFRRGGPGMEDFGWLATAFADISDGELSRLLRLVDRVKATQKCGACFLKVLAFCEIFTERRLPDLNSAYRREYDEFVKGMMEIPRFQSRDFRKEARDAVREYGKVFRKRIGWQFREQSGR